MRLVTAPCVEATPKNLRLRKKLLDENARKRAAQSRVIKVREAA
jgi:predicted membrane GTPase involved in stress response